MRILVVEDDPRLGPSLKKGLEGSHYAVDLVTDGEDAVAAALSVEYDLIILDRLLPRLNGLAVCQQLRNERRTMPILLLTALGELRDKVQGLDSGADDYLTKPFEFQELEARVRALLRRDGPAKSPELRFMDVVLDTRTHEVRRGERLVALSSKEYALLDLLLRHPRQVLSRATIADHVWDYDTDNLSNVIDVYIRYLRRKLCEGGEVDIIQTVRGSGYMLREPSE